jgi:predicted transcriptional regulator
MSLGLKELIVPVEVPVSPLSKKEVKLLETALIIGTVFREDVIKQIISKEEVTTWVDSLAVAAAALAMEKAGYPVSKIAEGNINKMPNMRFKAC